MQSKICYICGKNPLNKSEIGLTKKLLNRDIEVFYCINCLAEYLEVETEFLLQKVEEFKLQGCTLF